MSGRQSARTGRVDTSNRPRGIQQADKSIRVRNAGEKLLPRPRFNLAALTRRVEPPPACRWFLERRAGCPDWLSGRSRKRLLAMRSAQLLRRQNGNFDLARMA